MGTNYHTAYSNTSPKTTFTKDSMGSRISDLDRALTYFKGSFIGCDGVISWSAGTLTWTGSIHIYFNTTAGNTVHNSIAAGSIALSDGEFAYVTQNETNNAVLTVAKASITTGSASNFLSYNILLLGYRNTSDDMFYPLALTGALLRSVPMGGTGRSSVTVDSFLVGNGSGTLVEKTVTEVLTMLGLSDALTYKSAIDCSTNPDYPAANAGDYYRVSVAGKIGGASGIVVEVGDSLICNTDSTASGDQATVGSYWNVFQTNVDFASPPEIGATTPNKGTFTVLKSGQGIDIASAATIDLSVATGNYVEITGSTGPITSLGTVAAGAMFMLRFLGAPTLTHNATSLILPTSANITVEAGDRAVFISKGSGNWECHMYLRASGMPLTATATPTASKVVIADASGTVDGWVSTADESTAGKVFEATLAETLAGSDVSKYVTPDKIAELLALLKNPLQFSQAIRMVLATSGSNGIQVQNSNNINPLTFGFTLVVGVKLSDNTASAYLINKGPMNSVGLTGLRITLNAGYPYLRLGLSAHATDNATCTSMLRSASGTFFVLGVSVTRPASGVDGSVLFCENGRQLGDAIPLTAESPVSISNSNNLYVAGGNATDSGRTDATVAFVAMYNRALAEAEHLDLFRNGPAFKHFDQTGVSPASQTAQTSGTLVIGKEYRIDTYVSGDDFSNVASVVIGTINTSGCVFVATGTTPTTWTNVSSLRRTGIVWGITGEGMQPSPGQCLDFSGNKGHALQPAAGSGLLRLKKDFEYRWTNTWTASSAAQYVGGVNQNVMSARHCIDTWETRATVTTDVQNLEAGDGSDADRFVAAFTPSTTPTNQTLANRISGGTNKKLIYTPAASCTMTVETIIKGHLLES